MTSNQERRQSGLLGLPNGLFCLWLLLFSLWLIVNARIELQIVVSGALISLAVSWVFVRRSNVWQQVALTPRGAYSFLAYTINFFIELLKANINMLRYVYSPIIDIAPGIVKIRTQLKSPIGRLALANSIALTPGSLVMDIRGDAIFIHCLNIKAVESEAMTELIAGPFEKHLGVVFG
ncbi:Na+/H+ antiporter subunit E (plasmid) [Phyllobacterium sp. A18/5-2]|uniref:Na+/H+ antiporter subunit E n=1 Tax=Phyllobacterium sp. A18/5-2 TaxID=2978392 RepID=UPI0021C83814|nr:Na+/H+ antiporter subunit E [Phyllobacterium sp. A18/5-2]UXN66855.1 Na+/H+ antiporter subunit E [Phyllobacterium sp. A18/5-2]